MRFYSGNILAILFLLTGFSALSNDSAYVRFVFSAPLTSSKFYLAVHDGINEHVIDLQKKQSWRGELFSPFGHIEVRYNNSDTTAIQREVFFKKGSSKVVLLPSQKTKEHYFIDEKASENITSYNEMGGTVFDSFIKDKVDASIDFIQKNKGKFGSDNAILQKAFALGDSILFKKVDFVRRFPDLYVSFWTFLSQVVKSDVISPDTLMKVYNTAYSDKYKGCKAAKHLEAIILNKIAVRSSKSFPDFSAVDIENKKIESSKLRGKYVLIQFWASWCVPCVKEMPEVKKLNNKYKGPEFMLISYSIDKDSTAFRKALQKYSMDWAQIFGDDRLYNSLAQIPVPQFYLIDRTGRTIYNYTSSKDNDLSILKKVLFEHLKK